MDNTDMASYGLWVHFMQGSTESTFGGRFFGSTDRRIYGGSGRDCGGGYFFGFGGIDF